MSLTTLSGIADMQDGHTSQQWRLNQSDWRSEPSSGFLIRKCLLRLDHDPRLERVQAFGSV